MARTPSRIVLLVVASAAAALLAGCGASSGDDAAKDPTTTSAKATTTAPDSTTETSEVESTEPETTDVETTEATGDDICVPLKVLSDYDIESARLVAAGDWTAIQAYFVSETDEVLAAYDDAIALDTELTADLEELRAISEGTSSLAAEATDLSDLSAKLLALPGLVSAGQAGERLSTFAEANCGFATGANGQ